MSKPKPDPHAPKAPIDNDVRPEKPSENVKVTPLDEDKNIEKGIEVDET